MAGNPPPPPVGRYDTAQAWAAVTNVYDVINDLVMINLTHAFFDAANVSTEVLATIWTYASIRLHGVTGIPTGSALAYAIAEAIGLAIPANKILSQQNASTRFRDDIRNHFPILAKQPKLTQAQFDQAHQAVFARDNTAVDPSVKTFPIDFDPQNVAAGTAHPVASLNDAVTVCRILNQLLYGGNFQYYAVMMYTVLLCAVLKMGNVTEVFLSKIVAGIKTDIKIELKDLEINIVSTVWNLLGRYVNQENIGPITAHWNACIPQEALRLRLTVQQAAGEGLTALTVIKDALHSCNDFPWDHVNALIPQEAAAVTNAFNQVGTNQFYGYSKDLGIVRSTNYKTYSWIAKELMIRKFGKSSLNKYRGWTKQPAHAQLLETMITNYVNTPVSAATYAPGSVAHQAVATMQAAATAATGIAI